ncbi:MAG TPA: hypothetical protein VGG05_11375 [Pseudonocardiaceae bacterium]|jgi:hypothetical protein
MGRNASGSTLVKQPTPPWRTPVILAAVAVFVIAVVMGIALLTKPGGSHNATAPPAAQQPTSAPTTTVPIAVPEFRFVPLWPFASQAEVLAWQDSYHSGGHQPWHLDPAATALSFTRNYLGYTNIDRVVGNTATSDEMWVSVGFDDPTGKAVISAAIHLARFGGGADAAWEVVGTRDTTLTLTTPSYGASARSPVTVGGSITGVDENLRVQVRQLARSAPLGEASGAVGGDHAAWKLTVPFAGAAHGALTIAVSTGGHVAAVERFAITGVRY